ncbi:MAG: hypothetical protein R2704_09265 [Microthrixaceae bacterium]
MTTIPTQLPGRAPTGMSAILLPFTDDGDVDWAGFEAHVRRTTEAGLAPAVNMDTGYVQLIDDETHQRVLDTTHELAGSNFVAGAFVPDAAGDAFDQAALNRAALRVADAGGTPVIFPSHGLNGPTRTKGGRPPAGGAPPSTGSSGSNWVRCLSPTADYLMRTPH